MRKLANSELGRLTTEEYKKMDKRPLIIVLDNIRSALNVGSIFRSADCFLIEKICLCGFTAQPPHRDILKSALGATESVNWAYYNDIEDCIVELKRDHWEVIAIEQADKSTMLDNFQPESASKYALIFGNEVKGVSEVAIQQADKCIEVPQWGTKHSLNVSVCVGILLWHFTSKE